MIKQFFSLPLGVRISILFLVSIYVLLSVVITPFAIVIGVIGGSIYSVVTIINYLNDQ